VTGRREAVVAAHWGAVDVLVHNAGTLDGHALPQADWDDAQAARDLNERAALVCMREAAPSSVQVCDIQLRPAIQPF
jgi:NADP-dependent 3-hydroxy acid dehydrogenase YdfG